MATALFINRTDLVRNSIIDGNVDTDKFIQFIKIAQEIDIQNYIETGSPMDKAGAYGIQDSFGTLNIRSISGSYTNIIGLPVTQVLEKIKEIIQVQ